MTFAGLAACQRPATLAQIAQRLIPRLNADVLLLRRDGIPDAEIRSRLRGWRRTALLDLEPIEGPIWCESYQAAHERVMDDILGPERGAS